ncbi:ferritin-like domain-containing protein [Paragemmobacter aquarius]|uniref:ferritin-like domain-containing protein n=1 Tax=Paragemmobacter aquarius TaxID=2169400 RepID=UPI0026B5FC21
MQNEARDIWMDWLRDAHGMEAQAETMLNAQAGRLENYPALRMRIEQHLRETTAQREQLERLFETLGEDVSAVKAGLGKLMALGQGVAGAFASDEVMKGSLASYAFEHMEIASYTALIAGPRSWGLWRP